MELDVSQHYDKIYRYCYFRLHDRDLAEDVTQEAFLRFFASETYRDTGQALHYLKFPGISCTYTRFATIHHPLYAWADHTVEAAHVLYASDTKDTVF